MSLQNGELRGRSGVHPRAVPVEAGDATGGVSNFIPVHMGCVTSRLPITSKPSLEHSLLGTSFMKVLHEVAFMKSPDAA